MNIGGAIDKVDAMRKNNKNVETGKDVILFMDGGRRGEQTRWVLERKIAPRFVYIS